MPKQIYLNLPVKNLEASTKFYTALGFKSNTDYSKEGTASVMMWSEDIVIMLVTHDFYSKFTTKTIPDLTQTSSALIGISCDSRDEVQKVADSAKANGGSYFEAEPNKGFDWMFTVEVTDLDGHTLEPYFMDRSSFAK